MRLNFQLVRHCDRMTQIVAALAALCILFGQERYFGIWHDSILYLGQGLHLLHPETLSKDLFFQFGSQTEFTLAPELIASLLRQVPPGTLFLILTTLGLLAFLASSWWLICALLPPGQRYWSLLSVLLLPSAYGADQALHYAERFFTARTFAEPLLLACLGFWATGHRPMTVLLWFSAALLHPLQALPILAILCTWWALESPRRMQLMAAASIGLSIVALALPVEMFNQVMDAAWLSEVSLRNPITLYFSAGPSTWYNLLTDMFVLAIAQKHASGCLRNYLKAVLIATLVCALASLLLSDLLHKTLFLQAQLWRAHWIAHWSAMAMLPVALLFEFGKRSSAPLRWMVFLATVLLGLPPTVAHPLIPGVMLLYVSWPRLGAKLGPRTQGVLCCLLLFVAALHATNHLDPFGGLNDFGNSAGQGLLIRMGMLIGILATPVAAFLLPRIEPLGRITILAVSMVALAVVASRWDARSSFQKSMTQRFSTDNPFHVALPINAQVLWPENVLGVWNALNRSSYMSSTQMAGAPFNRSTAMEGHRRRMLLETSTATGSKCHIIVYPYQHFAPCMPDATATRQACRQTGGALGWVVLPDRLATPAKGQWRLGKNPSLTYYLYNCKDILGITQGTESINAP